MFVFTPKNSRASLNPCAAFSCISSWLSAIISRASFAVSLRPILESIGKRNLAQPRTMHVTTGSRLPICNWWSDFAPGFNRVLGENRRKIQMEKIQHEPSKTAHEWRLASGSRSLIIKTLTGNSNLAALSKCALQQSRPVFVRVDGGCNENY